MRVLVSGDRNWTDERTIGDELIKLQEEHGLSLLVVTGGATGADTIAAKLCTDLGIDLVIMPANWRARGKAAGPFRNGLMIKLIKPDLVLAFHGYLPGSKGTKNYVEQAEKRGIEVRLFAPKTRRQAVHA